VNSWRWGGEGGNSSLVAKEKGEGGGGDFLLVGKEEKGTGGLHGGSTI
jgi:hypothetical protein